MIVLTLVSGTSVADVHATMLHLMGINHEKLTWPYNGRQIRVTDLEGSLIKEMLT